MSKPDPIYRDLVFRVTKPVAGLMICALLALLAVIVLVADRQTYSAQERQAALTRHAVSVQAENLLKTARDYATWTEALDNLVIRFDAAWAKENIELWLYENFDIDTAFVVTARGEITYAFVHGVGGNQQSRQDVSDELRHYVEAAENEGSVPAGLAVVNGLPANVAVAPIVNTEEELPSGVERRFLVVVQSLRPSVLEKIATTYLLPGLALGEASDSGEPSIALMNGNARTIGVLAWQGDRPGDAMMKMMIPLWGFMALGLALVTRHIFRQADEAARLIEESDHRATHDLLTGLPNRAGLIRHLEAEWSKFENRQQRFSVLYIDLDGFKSVNDTHGHEAGDQILMVVAHRLRFCLANTGIVGRMGGDEFIVLLPRQHETSRVRALALALIAAIEQPIQMKNGAIASISATIGAATVTPGCSDPLALLQRADSALNLGKKIGKSNVHFASLTAGEGASAPAAHNATASAASLEPARSVR
ncbi:sensor domain-containing diguanylate cyclase [Jiella marina]|uniref:sensor domain-containing diguanylate cyclase n=1 Tax=Jiella sp. LLJ827 TaxID=2917712 RepID=UPI002100FC05|nr:diguanylate cyclase [Jiella sp. LLJ827]MCQ0989679.1 diguanylate cyclase [Jiella sp. LLJ827]